MSLPPGFSFTEAFDAALTRELDARAMLLDEPDQERAAELVAEAEAAAWQEVRAVATSNMVSEARARVAATEREQRSREAEAKRRDQEAADAARVWKKLYGRSIAKELEPWTAYTVLDAAAGRFVFAVPDELEPRLRSSLGGADLIGQSTGVGIAKITAKLSQGHQLDLVVTDEDGIAKAVAMVQAAEQERRDQDAAERRAAGVRLQRDREKARALSTFGVALPPDAE
jgi:hypothetical protein